MLRKLLLLMLMFLGGCDIEGMINESNNKTEYSILQYYEYEYREVKQDKPYMIFEHALNSNYSVVVFPIKDKAKGYVAILAQAEGLPKVKMMPNANFKVTKDAYATIKAKATLSQEVDQFIAEHVQR